MTTIRRSSRLGGGSPAPLSSKKKKHITTSSVLSSAVDENAPNLATRRPTRRQTATSDAMEKEENLNQDETAASDNEIMDQEEEDDDIDDAEIYVFNGVTYATYQEMVDAKRLRNQQVLVASGLLEAAAQRTTSSVTATANMKKKRRSSSSTASRSSTNEPQDRRKSKRLAGIESDRTFIEDERSGRFIIASGGGGDSGTMTTTTDINNNDHDRHRLRRINDGSDLSLEQAVQLIGPKWLEENSVVQAQILMRDILLPQQKREASSSLFSTTSNNSSKDCSSCSYAYYDDDETTEQDVDGKKNQYCSWTRQMQQQVQERSLLDNNIHVAKVVPDRIYSITTHPSAHQLVVCAGDKQGYVGMWNVDAALSMQQATDGTITTQEEEEEEGTEGNDNISPTTVTRPALEASKGNKSSSSSSSSHDDGIHLFRPHASTTACLEWTRQGTALLSTSYDGTCRLFDVAAERFQQVFDSSYLCNSVGIRLHESESDYYNDSSYWFQYACLDHRNQDCFFLSTSIGTAMHVDMRASGKERVTFHQELSEKKINSLSLHPNGYSLLSAGLDTKAQLWDLRLLSSNSGRSSSGRKRPGVQGPQVHHVAYYEAGRSINSAFFSPSGKYVVSTTMLDRLDILQDMHTAAGTTATTTALTKSRAAIRVEPVQSIRHNNKTGRWLSTFMAQWHGVHDVFCVGSMQQPRVMEVYFLNPLNENNNNERGGGGDHFGRGVALGGDAMTAVTSRCCFHAQSDELIVVGGTSSGRVAISR